MPLKPINTSCRILPHKLKPPYLQGDDRGGNVAHQNITMRNCDTGEVFTCHAAEPASRDPLDPVNIKGAYLKRVEKEREQIKQMGGAYSNSPNT
jgi:hypothetical protein